MVDIYLNELPHDGGSYEKLKDGRYRLLEAATQPAKEQSPAEQHSPAAGPAALPVAPPKPTAETK